MTEKDKINLFCLVFQKKKKGKRNEKNEKIKTKQKKCVCVFLGST